MLAELARCRLSELAHPSGVIDAAVRRQLGAFVDVVGCGLQAETKTLAIPQQPGGEGGPVETAKEARRREERQRVAEQAAAALERCGGESAS